MKKTAKIRGRNVIGARVRRLRLECRPTMTLHDLSERLAELDVRLDRSALGRIENSERYVLDYEALALAQALEVDLTDLFK